MSKDNLESYLNSGTCGPAAKAPFNQSKECISGQGLCNALECSASAYQPLHPISSLPGADTCAARDALKGTMGVREMDCQDKAAAAKQVCKCLQEGKSDPAVEHIANKDLAKELVSWSLSTETTLLPDCDEVFVGERKASGFQAEFFPKWQHIESMDAASHITNATPAVNLHDLPRLAYFPTSGDWPGMPNDWRGLKSGGGNPVVSSSSVVH